MKPVHVTIIFVALFLVLGILWLKDHDEGVKSKALADERYAQLQVQVQIVKGLEITNSKKDSLLADLNKTVREQINKAKTDGAKIAVETADKVKDLMETLDSAQKVKLVQINESHARELRAKDEQLAAWATLHVNDSLALVEKNDLIKRQSTLIDSLNLQLGRITKAFEPNTKDKVIKAVTFVAAVVAAVK